MKVRGIQHLGIAPRDIKKAKWFFGTVLGLHHLGDEVVMEQSTSTSMFLSTHQGVDRSPRLELLSHCGEGSGPIKSYLEKKGGGIHHIAILVDDIRAALKHLRDQDIQLVDEQPKTGAGNCLVAFVHPKSTGGILVELVEEPAEG